jgi:elongator complex protein 2
MYVSGSEEKVLRVFEAPQAFTDSLTAVRALQSPAAASATAAALAAAAAAAGSSDGSNGAGGAGRGRALGASVAALGLSNKAVYLDEDAESAGLHNGDAGGEGRMATGPEYYNEGPDFVPCAVPAVVSGPPLEEHLAQNTLWPEVRKLYGHGNEVFCVSASPSGRVIASACKAQSTGAAAVWVWEVGSWKSLAQLSGHTLTVTQLEFSPDGSYLLSGSRDRSFSVWKVPEQYRLPAAEGAAAAAVDGAGEFELVGRLKAAHSRIIWSVSWSHAGR